MTPYFFANTANEMWLTLADTFSREDEDSELNWIEGRGGRTKEILHAFLHLQNPRQRWMYSREPALNPAFAIAEVIWILAGRQDSAFLNHWNPKLPQFAGKGETYHGAYGWRLRHEHGVDQLKRAFDALDAEPASRQVVLDIWKPALDLPNEQGRPVAEDIPCNICSLLKVRDGQLHWTQIMRSNDIVLGLPHNIVQWTSIQEVFAGWLNLEVGPYIHFSDSLHLYERDVNSVGSIAPHPCEEVQNTDSLSLPFEQFTPIFGQMEQKAEAMIAPDLTSNKLSELANLNDAPEAYQNLLLILAADTARRRGWQSDMVGFAEKCSNPVLRHLWERWIQRQTA